MLSLFCHHGTSVQPLEFCSVGQTRCCVCWLPHRQPLDENPIGSVVLLLSTTRNLQHVRYLATCSQLSASRPRLTTRHIHLSYNSIDLAAECSIQCTLVARVISSQCVDWNKHCELMDKTGLQRNGSQSKICYTRYLRLCTRSRSYYRPSLYWPS